MPDSELLHERTRTKELEHFIWMRNAQRIIVDTPSEYYQFFFWCQI